jgi:hypothetical protein
MVRSELDRQGATHLTHLLLRCRLHVGNDALALEGGRLPLQML